MIFFTPAVIIQPTPLVKKSELQQELLRKYIGAYCRGEILTKVQQEQLRRKYHNQQIDTFTYYQLMLIIKKSQGQNEVVDTRMLRDQQVKNLLKIEAELATKKPLSIEADANLLQLIERYLDKQLESESTYCRYLYQKFSKRITKNLAVNVKLRLLLIDGREDEVTSAELEKNSWLMAKIISLYEKDAKLIKLALLEKLPAAKLDTKLSLMEKGGFLKQRQNLLADLVYKQNKAKYKPELIASFTKLKDENLLKSFLSKEQDLVLVQKIVNTIGEVKLLRKLLPLLNKRNIHNYLSLDISTRQLLLTQKRTEALKLLQGHPELLKGKLHELYEKIAWLEGVKLEYKMPLLKSSAEFISGKNNFFISQPEKMIPLKTPNQAELFAQLLQLKVKPQLIKFFLNTNAAALIKFEKEKNAKAEPKK